MCLPQFGLQRFRITLLKVGFNFEISSIDQGIDMDVHHIWMLMIQKIVMY